MQDLSLRVILDVVRRYDIDGVHLDDYFYPYQEKDVDGKPIPFPDDDTWAAYQKKGGGVGRPAPSPGLRPAPSAGLRPAPSAGLGRDDWRRDAVNRFVERLYEDVKSAKPWVKVGISPFGIWRPGNPPGIAGFDAYAGLYADSRLWLREGWVDYFTPQLYWPIKQEKQSFPKLLAWWQSQNPKNRHIYPGLIPSRVGGGAKGWPVQEIADQIQITRDQGAGGNILFSMKALLRNRGGVADKLKEVYAEPATVPPTPWLPGRKR